MPFTEAQLFAVFTAWNTAVWPLQLVAYGLGLVAVGCLIRPSRGSTGVILAILALMWLVNGVGFHWSFYTAVTPAAWIFGAAFILQALLLAGAPFVAPDFRIVPARDPRTAVGLALVAYALFLYPLLGRAFGQVYPAIPTFGIAPCPTTIFTIGLLVLGPWRRAKWLLVIPALWGLVGGSAAFLFGVPQDYGLILAMLVVVAVAIGHRFGSGAARHRAGRP